MSGRKPSPCPADCVYGFRAEGQICCQYILLTGRCRPCPPGWKHCTVYERRQGEALPYCTEPRLASPAPAQTQRAQPPKPAKKPKEQPGRRATPAELEAQAAFLRGEREARKLSQEYTAFACGVSVSSVRGWERCVCRANWAKLEQVFPGISVRWQKHRAEEGIA